MKRIIVLLGIFITAASAFAADEVELGEMVVTATRTEESVEKIPSSVTIITSEEIERKQAVTVLEVLRGVPALDVVQQGGAGKSTSVFVRGGNSGHTLVLIDGVQVNSPSSGSYNFANLMTENIERIEVVRGPHSTLYGSDAVAGVINIITKRGKGKPRFSISAEKGTYNSKKGSLSVRGGSDRFDYSLALSKFESGGFSAASEKNGNTEKDGYENKTIAARLGYKLNGNILLDFTFRKFDADSDIDSGSSGIGVDDPNYRQETAETTFSANIQHIVNAKWDHAVTLSVTDEKIEMIEPDPDPWNYYNSKIETETTTVGWQHNLYLLEESHTLTLGLEHEKAEAENVSAAVNHSVSNDALYLQDQIALADEKLNLVAGVRYDDHEKFGDETTYRAAASYLADSTKTTFRASYAKAFKAPTINDLYYSNPAIGRGNPNLNPEESKGLDVGVKQKLMENRIVLSATYFRNDFENLITWVEYAPWLYEPRNLAKARTDGWELGLDLSPIDNLKIISSYTRTDTRDEQNNRELIRRPKKKGNISINWDIAKVNINLTANYVGKRVNNYDFLTGAPVILESYTKADIAASYRIMKNINLFGRVENFNNREYEEVKDYGTAGRSYYAGLKAEF